MNTTRRTFLSSGTLAAVGCGLTSAIPCLASADETAPTSNQTAMPPKPLNPKAVVPNPFMGTSESNIHHDCCNTDSTDAVLPMGIFPEVNVAFETTNPNASPAIFFDNFDNPVSPLLGGLAIRDHDAEEVGTLGCFSPTQHDGGGYVIQSSYSFVDSRNLIVCPTNHNHVLMLRATDETGTPLPVFEKVLDIDVKAAAEAAFGVTIDQNLLSIVFDYEGNLWFVTGGFRIYPDRGQQGAMGYISAAAIDAILAGNEVDLSQEVHVYLPEPGEGAENGIASCTHGAVILTNLACYMLRANDGVEVMWRTPYESAGAKDSREGAATTGGGLAWGGGCSPSLGSELVFFTDNLETVSLLALSMETGEVVASCPIIDELPADMPVSVENSAMVYDDGQGRASVIACNWFGAGSPNLAKPDSDSSIQSYENIYDTNWLLKGNCMIIPGIERVDTIKTDDGYVMESIWCRDDISDTSMMKLSTATGYIYGYVQDLTTGMWQFIALDFETGETTLTVDVASPYGYNNMAIGMYAAHDGNRLYCPTGYKELMRLQDRFAYLPEMPYRKVDLDKTTRTIVTAEEFAAAGGQGTPATWLHGVAVRNVHPQVTLAVRVNGLEGQASDYRLFALGADGTYREVTEGWSLEGTGEGELAPENIYEIRLTVQDGGDIDLDLDERQLRVAVLLAR